MCGKSEDVCGNILSHDIFFEFIDFRGDYGFSQNLGSDQIIGGDNGRVISFKYLCDIREGHLRNFSDQVDSNVSCRGDLFISLITPRSAVISASTPIFQSSAI